MSDATPGGKHQFGPLGRFLDLLDRMVSARADGWARRLGHTVTREPGSRVHVYRDPRWDRRREAMLGGTELIDHGERR